MAPGLIVLEMACSECNPWSVERQGLPPKPRGSIYGTSISRTVRRAMDQTPTIPSYHLYGEDGPAEDFDFFHIESIPARSKSLGWSLEPHAHAHLFQLLLITEGAGQLTGDADEEAILPGKAVFLPAGSVHGWTFHPGTQGFVLSFTRDYLSGGSVDLSQSEMAALTCSSARVKLLDEDSQRRLIFALSEMAREASTQARRAVFRSLLSFSLVLLFEPERSQATETAVTGFSLVGFNALVEDNFRKERGAEFYARAMGLTVARLNRYCRLFLDRTAAQAVRDRVILEAKRLLSYSGESVQEIAFSLGYEDPAYFSRIFSKEAGMSPQDFRNRPSEVSSKE